MSPLGFQKFLTAVETAAGIDGDPVFVTAFQFQVWREEPGVAGVTLSRLISGITASAPCPCAAVVVGIFHGVTVYIIVKIVDIRRFKRLRSCYAADFLSSFIFSLLSRLDIGEVYGRIEGLNRFGLE